MPVVEFQLNYTDKSSLLADTTRIDLRPEEIHFLYGRWLCARDIRWNEYVKSSVLTDVVKCYAWMN